MRNGAQVTDKLVIDLALDKKPCAGAADNTVGIARAEIVAGLRGRMIAPELVAAVIDEFNAELRRWAGGAEAEGAAAQRALAEANRKIAGIVEAIEDGAYSSILKERLAVLERRKSPLPRSFRGNTPTRAQTASQPSSPLQE